MDQLIKQKIDQWISGNYEQSVKDEILRLQKDQPDDLVDAFLFITTITLPFAECRK